MRRPRRKVEDEVDDAEEDAGAGKGEGDGEDDGMKGQGEEKAKKVADGGEEAEEDEDGEDEAVKGEGGEEEAGEEKDGGEGSEKDEDGEEEAGEDEEGKGGDEMGGKDADEDAEGRPSPRKSGAGKPARGKATSSSREGGAPAARAEGGGKGKATSRSKHGKELMASHELPSRAPPAVSWKPAIAGLLLFMTALGGFYYSGGLMAVPLSPQVTGDAGDIDGQVKEKDDGPIPNASVSVGTKRTSTNATGWFELNGVPVGRQVIVVDAPGYRQLRFDTFIGGNPIRISALVLSPGNGTETVDNYSGQAGQFYTCGGVLLLFTAFTFLGALLCILRRGYTLAATGALMGVGLFPLWPISIGTGLGALLLLLFSRGEFS